MGAKKEREKMQFKKRKKNTIAREREERTKVEQLNKLYNY